MIHRWINTLLLIACLAGIGCVAWEQHHAWKREQRTRIMAISACEDIEIIVPGLQVALVSGDLLNDTHHAEQWAALLNEHRDEVTKEIAHALLAD